MIGIADSDATAHPVGMHDHGHANRGLGGVASLHLGDQASLRNSAADEVVASHPAFAEFWVGACTSRRDHDRRQSAMEQIEALIEPGPQHGRRAPRIFRRAENNDGIGGLQFLQSRRLDDANAGDGKEHGHHHRE